ncbi:hypothetical protein Tco_1001235 [Tanacetum coccineum]
MPKVSNLNPCQIVGIRIATVDKAMWGWGLVMVMVLECCGESTRFDIDKMWGLAEAKHVTNGLGLGHVRGQLDPLDTLACSALSRDEDYDQIPDDDFATASVVRRLILRFFLLLLALMSCLIPLRTILPLTIPGNSGMGLMLRRIISYALNRKSECITELRAEVSSLEEKYDKVQEDCSALDKESRELRSRNDALSKELKRLKVQLADAESTAARSADELARTDAKLSDQALVMIGLQDELAHERSKS